MRATCFLEAKLVVIRGVHAVYAALSYMQHGESTRMAAHCTQQLNSDWRGAYSLTIQLLEAQHAGSFGGF